jgi:hypothetical protein
MIRPSETSAAQAASHHAEMGHLGCLTDFVTLPLEFTGTIGVTPNSVSSEPGAGHMAGSLSINYLTKYVSVARWTGIPASKVAIETGTYQGNGTAILAQLFSAVHTVELSPKWHEFSSRRLACYENVTCHQGDSADFLEQINTSISYPATFVLDAHFSGGDTAFGSEEVPLFRELQILSRRPYSDLIIIDDLRLIGKSGECGSENTEYPPMVFDWRSVTIDRIAHIINRNNRTHWLFENDRIVIFRNLSRLQAGLLRVLLWLYPGKITASVLRRIRILRT